MPKLKSLAIMLGLITQGMLCQSAYTATTLSALSDEQLAEVEGQALMSLSYIAPTDPANPMGAVSSNHNVGFYKLGLEALLELNANIKTLQLGCGGVNGVDGCDIDIRNLALSGLPLDQNGNIKLDANNAPDFTGIDRAATSAQITNPFVQFAIKNPNSASQREMVGLRFSADSIKGLLTAGLENRAGPSTDDGILSLSGFMPIASTTGSVTTEPAIFGKAGDEFIEGNLTANILFMSFDRVYRSNPTHADNHGITIPSIGASFTVPAFNLNGQRLNRAVVGGINVGTQDIPLDQGPLNQLYVTFDAILGLANHALFQMGPGSKLTGLKLNASFEQSLSMVHNIPLTGQGGYLALQTQSLKWPGTHAEDIAQRGWWLGFNEQVQLGNLSGQVPVNISDVLPQVAQRISVELKKPENKVTTTTSESLGTLFSTPIVKELTIDVSNAAPATILLQNMQLKNQAVTANCYGTLKFC